MQNTYWCCTINQKSQYGQVQCAKVANFDKGRKNEKKMSYRQDFGLEQWW